MSFSGQSLSGMSRETIPNSHQSHSERTLIFNIRDQSVLVPAVTLMGVNNLGN